jgi:hypothetical protein
VHRLHAALSLTLFLLAFAASAAASPPLVGVWEIEEIRTVGPDLDATNTDPQPGLYIFTSGFYSMVWSPGRESRKDSARMWEPTDEEKVRDFNTIVVNSGTYETVDSTLIVRPLTAKTPEYVGGHATYTYQVQGDKLRLTLLDTFSHNGIEDQGIARYRTTLWLRRIE